MRKPFLPQRDERVSVPSSLVSTMALIFEQSKLVSTCILGIFPAKFENYIVYAIDPFNFVCFLTLTPATSIFPSVYSTSLPKSESSIRGDQQSLIFKQNWRSFCIFLFTTSQALTIRLKPSVSSGC